LLHESEYVSLPPDAEGIIKSQVMPGLWLSVTALLAGDLVKGEHPKCVSLFFG
jgi:hypothetical protein